MKEDAFAGLVISDNNSLPLQAARRVALDDDTAGIFLFCGASGAGKTCLLQAVLASFGDEGGTVSLHDTSAFLGQYPPGEKWEKLWQGRKALLLDDLQLAHDNAAWQEQLVSLIDSALQCPERRLIFAMLGTASDAGNFGERLASRLEGALVTELAQPDLGARLHYLKQLAQSKKIALDKEEALFLARRASGFRQIQGFLEKAKTWQLASEKNLDLCALESLIKNGAQSAPTLEKIVEQTARAFNVTADEIRGVSRKPETAMARQAAMYVCRKKLGLSYPELGRAFRRDHSTVIHAVKKIEELFKTDKLAHKLLSDIENASA